MKGKKMLITIALVVVMLLNCMTPILTVSAADMLGVDEPGSETYQFNYQLYAAIVRSLTNYNNSHESSKIVFTSDDNTRRITISDEEIAKVTELDLNNAGISSIAGLGIFTNLTHLELSANKLTSASSLGELNSLVNLTHLDLSTNNLEDIGEIKTLIYNIKDNGGEVLLSGQVLTVVREIEISEEEDASYSTEQTVELPKILEQAGYIRYAWNNQASIAQNPLLAPGPQLIRMDNPVTEGYNKVTFKVANAGIIYKGMYSGELYIQDDNTAEALAANLNPSAVNSLAGTRVYFYVIVYGSNDTAITLPDTNLYLSVKQQLSAGQTVNHYLDSYPYEIDPYGELVYDECVYDRDTYSGVVYYKLRVKNTVGYKYVLYNGRVYKYDASVGAPYLGAFYTSDYEFVSDVQEVDEATGTVTHRQGYKVKFPGANETLYEICYDAPHTFIINKDTLINKITSLILDHKEILKLDGIEKFVGLKSYLNVSANYLSNIDPIYDIQVNKDEAESNLQTKYGSWLSTRSYGNLAQKYNKVKSDKATADSTIKQISEAILQVQKLMKEASEIPTTNADGTPNTNLDAAVKQKAEAIGTQIKSIYGYTDPADPLTGAPGAEHEGYIDKIEDNLEDLTTNVKLMYSYLDALYEIYSKHYKLATLLTADMNYITLDEYKTYKEKADQAATAKAMVQAEVGRITGYEANGNLSSLELSLIREFYGIEEPSTTNPTPIAKYFQEYLNQPGSLTMWSRDLNVFREIGVLSEAANYCLLKRMALGDDVASTECFCEEYLTKRIEEFEFEGIIIPEDDGNPAIENEVELLNKLKNNDATGSILYTTFRAYINSSFSYTKDGGSAVSTLFACKGPYTDIDKLEFENTNFDLTGTDLDTVWTRAGAGANNKDLLQSHLAALDVEAKIPKTATIYEFVTIATEAFKSNELDLYKQLMAVAGKLVSNSSEVSRYITLAKLKKLDISDNAYLEGFERLGELSSLRELYANSDYICDLSDVDWTAFECLRKLGLGYNFIESVAPLEVLSDLAYLDVSHNLIEGTFDLNLSRIYNGEDEFFLNASYNRLKDITNILQFIEWPARGRMADYFLREDSKISMDLSHQTIEINIEEPFILCEHPETVDYYLNTAGVKIFTQLKAIDAERTTFGTASTSGRLESQGTYVTLNTRTMGDKEATVMVLPDNGYDTNVGIGTVANIKYTVSDRIVSGVTIDPTEGTMHLGGTQAFTAEVSGENLVNKTVTFSVIGSVSETESTTISEEGVLTIGADETAETLTVRATANYDNTKYADAVITVFENIPAAVESVTVAPQDGIVRRGSTLTLTATVTGINLKDEDKVVTWNLTGNTNPDTKISTDGVLSVAEDETATSLIVIATSTKDRSKAGTATVTVGSAVGLPSLGYELDEDEDIIGVSPDTAVSNFKTKLLADEDYTVSVKREGTELEDNVSIGTGDLVVITKDGAVLGTFEVVVKGDVNGDGTVDITDTTLVKSHRSRITSLTGVFLKAGDVDGDGEITVTDVRLILAHRARIEGYIL